jgi:hypothetical protein
MLARHLLVNNTLNSDDDSDSDADDPGTELHTEGINTAAKEAVTQPEQETEAPPPDDNTATTHQTDALIPDYVVDPAEIQQAQQEANAKKKRTGKGTPKYKRLVKVPATSELLNPSVKQGFVARHHYTANQVNILVSMKRGSSGISYEQAVDSCYGGEPSIEDLIPIQRVRDKQETDRYYITPSVPRQVVAARVLTSLESKMREGKTSTQEDVICQEAAEISEDEGILWKWRYLFAKRKLDKVRDEKEAVEQELDKAKSKNGQLVNENRDLFETVEQLKAQRRREADYATKVESQLERQKEEIEAAKTSWSQQLQQRRKEEAKAWASSQLRQKKEAETTKPVSKQQQGGTASARKPKAPPAPVGGCYPTFPGYFPFVPPPLLSGNSILQHSRQTLNNVYGHNIGFPPPPFPTPNTGLAGGRMGENSAQANKRPPPYSVGESKKGGTRNFPPQKKYKST